ncbi:hypothetical protein [Mesomycoplasma ovipneumoniae]|uniref:hypothetical protein n=1 Tax=Mesomycoplasma ovipneumoniae TaxID=29562 RepID=UPI002963C9F6|nr:hypothetical protein [Mesomycoplasma ovipneumoniae]MDW2918877.1 hypothetical protein [Mesomycoplasma ovipneumoniae]
MTLIWAPTIDFRVFGWSLNVAVTLSGSHFKSDKTTSLLNWPFDFCWYSCTVDKSFSTGCWFATLALPCVWWGINWTLRFFFSQSSVIAVPASWLNRT